MQCRSNIERHLTEEHRLYTAFNIPFTYQLFVLGQSLSQLHVHTHPRVRRHSNNKRLLS